MNRSTTLKTETRRHVAAVGTDWPENVVLTRYNPARGRPLFTVSVVCNGTVSHSFDFRLKRDAIEHFDNLMRWPTS
jgi:hypothetical protein